MLKALRVALFVKPSAPSYKRDDRNMGYFSYAVPEFTWEHHTLHDNDVIDTRRLAQRGYDLIWHEDSGIPVTYNRGALPVVYLAIDSTLSAAHYLSRQRIALQADLTLVDHDRLDRWPEPARRLGYCVNDKVFVPLEGKDAEVAYHCATGAQRGLPGAPTRTMLRQHLHGMAERYNWRYRSGARGLQEYAASIAGAKVCVNWPRVEGNRPHRILDALACQTCLITGPIPHLECDQLVEGQHYFEVAHFDELSDRLRCLLEDGSWQTHALYGRELVAREHTWAVAATRLRMLLNKELGL